MPKKASSVLCSKSDPCKASLSQEYYGAQPPIELIRQWMDYNGWYNRKAGRQRASQTRFWQVSEELKMQEIIAPTSAPAAFDVCPAIMTVPRISSTCLPWAPLVVAEPKSPGA